MKVITFTHMILAGYAALALQIGCSGGEPASASAVEEVDARDAGADCWYHETWAWPIACTFATDGSEMCILTGAEGGAH